LSLPLPSKESKFLRSSKSKDGVIRSSLKPNSSKLRNQSFTTLRIFKSSRLLVEKVIEVPRTVERIKEVKVKVEKIVEKIVEVPKVVEVERIVEKDRCCPKSD
jgi:hypothetical protein